VWCARIGRVGRARPYEEIAQAVGKTPAAVRQIARRAGEHVAARRPRVQVSRAEQSAVVRRFLAAVRGGDLRIAEAPPR
jgi:RNA polymerase sigma-70 factor (ECF subfamily)